MKNKRGKEWGTGWDGKSRVPDKQYKENYDSIDWSNLNKKEEKDKKQTLPPDVINQMNWVLREAKLENINEME